VFDVPPKKKGKTDSEIGGKLANLAKDKFLIKEGDTVFGGSREKKGNPAKKKKKTKNCEQTEFSHQNLLRRHGLRTPRAGKKEKGNREVVPSPKAKQKKKKKSGTGTKLGSGGGVRSLLSRKGGGLSTLKRRESPVQKGGGKKSCHTSVRTGETPGQGRKTDPDAYGRNPLPHKNKHYSPWKEGKSRILQNQRKKNSRHRPWIKEERTGSRMNVVAKRRGLRRIGHFAIKKRGKGWSDASRGCVGEKGKHGGAVLGAKMSRKSVYHKKQ